MSYSPRLAGLVRAALVVEMSCTTTHFFSFFFGLASSRGSQGYCAITAITAARSLPPVLPTFLLPTVVHVESDLLLIHVPLEGKSKPESIICCPCRPIFLCSLLTRIFTSHTVSTRSTSQKITTSFFNMRYALMWPALAGLTLALPRAEPQPQDLSEIVEIVQAAPAPVLVTAPLDVTTQVVSARHVVMEKRDGNCATQPAGSGPLTTPDDPADFLANPVYAVRIFSSVVD